VGVVVGAAGDGKEGGGGQGQGQGVGSMLCVSSGGGDTVGICKGSVEHPTSLAFLGRRREGIIGDAMLIRQSSVNKMQIPLQTNVPFILLLAVFVFFRPRHPLHPYAHSSSENIPFRYSPSYFRPFPPPPRISSHAILLL